MGAAEMQCLFLLRLKLQVRLDCTNCYVMGEDIVLSVLFSTVGVSWLAVTFLWFTTA